MEGWNGDRGSSCSYRQEIMGSNASSSRSGTIVSSAYTSSASSRPSTFSMEVAMHFDSLGIHDEHNGNNVDDYDGMPWGCWEDAADECMVRIRSLVQQFSIESSANCSIKIGGMSVVERWLTELGVGWVLNLNHVASAGEDREPDRGLLRWIWALDEIAQTICFVRPIFPDSGSMGLPRIGEEEHAVGETCIPDRHHLVLFIQETMLKMLTFVDIIVALDTFYSYSTKGFTMGPVMAPLYNKLIALRDVYNALSRASNKIVSRFGLPTSVEVQRIENEMTIILSANRSKVCGAIWSQMENIGMKLVAGINDSSSSPDPQGSSDIHKATWLAVMYIKFLCSKNMRDVGHVRPLDSMISEMVSCLEEKLANVSKSFPDEGLGFLFLLNNLYNILQQVEDLFKIYFDLTHKIEGHIERYLEVSWAPLLSCLLNPTPLFLWKKYSPLSKFESYFHKIYTTQKQWKVPNPWLRARLCMAIRDKIMPAYIEYLEVNKVTTPKFTPQELDEMLQEMFEG